MLFSLRLVHTYDASISISISTRKSMCEPRRRKHKCKRKKKESISFSYACTCACVAPPFTHTFLALIVLTYMNAYACVVRVKQPLGS